MTRRMSRAPIAIFVYRRPDHTQRLLDSLKINNEINDTEIYIFSDGIKNPEDENEVRAVTEVRNMCMAIDFAKNIHFKPSTTNKGLAESILSGVSTVLEKYDRIIILEDDLELSPKFLTFMNSALEIYQNIEQVFHVSGYWFPVEGSDELPPTFFYNTASCWGWGTWKRAWKHFETDPKILKEKIQLIDPDFSRFNLNNTADFLLQLDLNIEGKLKTWAVKWYASMFIHNGHALHPNASYINNIGHDSSGTNCGANSIFDWKHLSLIVEVKEIPIIENELSRKKMIDFYKKKKHPPLTLKSVIRKLLPQIIKNMIKSKILKK